MANKGCNSCTHHKRKLDFESNLSSSNCGIGNQKEYNLWWQNNGHKTSDDELDDMECFTQSEASKAMDRMHEILDEMLELAKQIKQ